MKKFTTTVSGGWKLYCIVWLQAKEDSGVGKTTEDTRGDRDTTSEGPCSTDSTPVTITIPADSTLTEIEARLIGGFCCSYSHSHIFSHTLSIFSVPLSLSLSPPLSFLSLALSLLSVSFTLTLYLLSTLSLFHHISFLSSLALPPYVSSLPPSLPLSPCPPLSLPPLLSPSVLSPSPYLPPSLPPIPPSLATTLSLLLSVPHSPSLPFFPSFPPLLPI